VNAGVQAARLLSGHDENIEIGSQLHTMDSRSDAEARPGRRSRSEQHWRAVRQPDLVGHHDLAAAGSDDETEVEVRRCGERRLVLVERHGGKLDAVANVHELAPPSLGVGSRDCRFDERVREDLGKVVDASDAVPQPEAPLLVELM
jgi:hypothetical protein